MCHYSVLGRQQDVQKSRTHIVMALSRRLRSNVATVCKGTTNPANPMCVGVREHASFAHEASVEVVYCGMNVLGSLVKH